MVGRLLRGGMRERHTKEEVGSGVLTERAACDPRQMPGSNSHVLSIRKDHQPASGFLTTVTLHLGPSLVLKVGETGVINC